MVDGAPDDQDRINQFARDIAPYASAVVAIEDDQTDDSFAEFFAEAREKRGEIEEWFESVKRPLNESLRRLNAKQHELCDPIRELEDRITAARSAYLDRKQREAEEESRRLAQESGGGTAVMAPRPQQTVSTAAGDVTIQWRKSWRLTDEHLITARLVTDKKMILTRDDPRLKNVPDKAFVLVPSLVTALLKTGSIPEGEHSIESYNEAVSQFRKS